MPTVSITLSQAALDRIKVVVDKFNSDTGENLTPKQWVIQRIKSAVTGAELHTHLDELQKQQKSDFEAEIIAKDQELKDGLEVT